MLKAGVIQKWVYHQTYSGTPQGGVISSPLSNKMLNKLEKFLMREIIPQYKKGKRRKRNPKYTKVLNDIRKAKKEGNRELVKELTRQLRQLSSIDPFDSNYCRVWYVRYADDFLPRHQSAHHYQQRHCKS